jgi:hypothetical protein
MWTTDMVPGHVTTVYAVIGDAFAYLCIIITVSLLGFMIIQSYLKRKRAKNHRVEKIKNAEELMAADKI